MGTPSPKSGRQLVLEQLHAHKSHELIPRSGKVVAFDIDLSLRHALDALAEHRVTHAPLWDSASQEFVAMLGGEDFARLLALLGRDAAHGPTVPLGRSPDNMSLRDLLRASRPSVPPSPNQFVSLTPDDTLIAAVEMMLERRLRYLPLVDQGSSAAPSGSAAVAAAAAAAGASSGAGAGATILHVLTPLRLLNCVVNSPMFQADASIFGERLVDLAMCTLLPSPHAAAAVVAAAATAAGLGDSGASAQLDASAHGGVQGGAVCVAAYSHSPLWHALVLMGQYGVSSLPILDSVESGLIVSALTDERVQAIARSMPHTDLSAPLLSALGPTPPTADEVSVRASDSLHALMAALSSRNIERLALANDAGQLVGAVSVLDVLKFFAVEQ